MFAAFHLPDLPVAAALLAHPQWRDSPCAVLRESKDRDDGKIPLLAINTAARRTGIAAAWPLGRALVRCPDLKLLDRHPAHESTLLADLTALADSHTPDVEITSPDTVLLDLSGARDPRVELLPCQGVLPVFALAGTPDLAHFAVLGEDTRSRFIATSDIAELPLALLSQLAGGGKFLPLLDLLGIHTLGDFRKLSRQQLTARFGPPAGHWHDLVAGKSCRLLKLHRPPESLAQTLELDDALHSSEALVFIFRRLLQVLCARLAARHLAASVLDVRLILVEGEMRRSIHLPEPLTDPDSLLKPLQTMAESLVLHSPVTAIQLDATAAFPLSRQGDWNRRQLPRPEQWADTLARLEALLGHDRVGIPAPTPSHRPDAFEMVAAADQSPIPTCSIPLRRFRPPLEIAVAFESPPHQHPRPLALLTGPYHGEILEHRGPFPSSGEAWDPDRSWQRLEWDIRLHRAPLLRLVFQPVDHWQLDGIYI